MRLKGISGLVRCSIAFTLVSTLIAPSTTAFADSSDESVSSVGQGQSSDQEESSQALPESESVQEDQTFDEESLLQHVGEDGQEADSSSSKGLLDDDSSKGDEKVTIIVQLEEGGSQGVSLFSWLGGTVNEDRHQHFKNEIRSLAGDDASDEEAGILSLFSSESASADDSIDELYDYYNAIDGFAIKAPASILEDVKALDGVKNAFIEQSYQVPADQGDQSSYKNQSSLDMTGADEVDQKGDGQVIAIIDSGLDVDHEAFSGDLDDSQVALTADDVAALKSSLSAGGASGAYISEKIPFVYDYADKDADVDPGTASGMEHGTHVAGIASANGGDQILGAAPNAQIMMMKVAGNFDGSIYDSVLLAALDDTAAIAPDVVNMSLGSDAGFSDEASSTYSDAIDQLEAEGTTVNVAAGNAYSAAYGNQSGENLPYATDPDSGIISTPSTLASAVSVASVNNQQGSPYFTASDGSLVAYLQANAYEVESVKQFSDLADGSWEYVDAGLGTWDEVTAAAEPYGGSLSGKIVLVQRGGLNWDGNTLSFSDKVSNAWNFGAEAVIVYDNVDEDLVSMGIDNAYYPPAVFISKSDGEALKAAQTKTLTVEQGKTLSASSDYTMSDFSSWGVTPDMKLKPDITAPGGNIYSSVSDGGYAYMSGTSMATPQMAGISALVNEYVENDSKFDSLSDDERNDVVMQLLMSTAKPLANTAEEGSYYSPRQQGAGLANVPAATSSTVYATVDGADDASRPQANLGDSTDGSWSFTVTLHNVGSEDQSYTPDIAALSEEIEGGLFQQVSKNWTGQGIDVALSGSAYDGSDQTVTVPAQGSASFTVSITCGDAFKQAVAEAANGTFVDGFALLESTDGGVDLSVPFMGFYGDWGEASAFDNTLWDADGYHIYGTVMANGNSGYPLGINPLDEDAMNRVDMGNYSDIDPNKMVVSNMGYSSAPSSLRPLTGLLRSVDSLTYEYKNEQDETVKEYSYDHVSKSYYLQSQGYVLYSEALTGSSAFDGTDEQGDRLGDGTYTLTQTAAIAGAEGETQTNDIFTFQYDTQKPVVSDIELAGEGADATLSFTVTDNTYLAAYDFHDPETGGYFYRVLAPSEPDEIDAAGNKVYHFSVKVSDVVESWVSEGVGTAEDIPSTLPLYAWDYGLNPSNVATAVIEEIPATSISLSANEVALAPGQQTKLEATLVPEDTTEKNVVWSSSDEGVVSVDDQGNLTGVSAGQAVVTVASEKNSDVKAEATVEVAPVADSVGVIMSQSSLSVTPQASAEVKALLSDSLQGSVVTWSSSNEAIASVSAHADDSSQADVAAGDNIGDAVITASVEGADSVVRTADMTVHVRPSDYDDFDIDENGNLIGYKGNSSYVTIPNNVTSIGEMAFQATPVQTVVVPASVESIGKYAFRGTARLSTVIFEDTDENPSRLTEVGDEAFSNTGVLDVVKLPRSVTKLGVSVFMSSTIKTAVIPQGVTEIPDSTFLQAAQLHDLTISDDVTTIGADAFNICNSLSTIKLSHADSDELTEGLPSSLKSIGDAAFSSTALTKAILPSGVESVGNSAFALAGIQEIELNEGLKYLGTQAFQGAQVSSLSVPDSVNNVGTGAFAYMSALTQITFGRNIPAEQLVGGFVGDSSLQSIVMPEDAFNYTTVDGALFDKAVTELIAYPLAKGGTYTVPEGVTAIADYALQQAAITGIVLPSTLESVGASSFMESKLSGNLTFPDGMKTIGGSAFMNAAISSLDLGGTQSIGGSAFYSNVNLTDIDFRTDLNRLTSVGNRAFAMSDSIQAVVLPDSLSSVGDGAFSNIGGLQKVHLGAGLTTSFTSLFTGSNNLSELTVSADNPVYYAEQNVLYGQMDDGLHLILSLPTNTYTEYTVKAGTVQIDEQAFRNNDKLQRVVLPEGLKTLTTGSFNNCTSLTEIVFPDSLEIVDGLYSVPLDVADFGTNIKSIGDNSFMGNMPAHIVVRGGQEGLFADSMDWSGSATETAYFGPGMKSVTFGWVQAPSTLVVPADLETLSFTYWGFDPSSVTVYAPAGSNGAAVAAAELSRVGADPSTQLKEYTPLAVTPSSEVTPQPGLTVSVTADVIGGVEGDKEVRFLQMKADGSTEVLQDWSTDATVDWTVPSDGMGLVSEVRDATMLTAKETLGSVSTPQFSVDLYSTPYTVVQGTAGPTLSVAVQADNDATVTYQWYVDGEAIEGATGASYTPAVDQVGEHAYHVVAMATKDGLSATATSSQATITVVPVAQAPIITQDLPASVDAIAGQSLVLTVGVQTPETGSLSYQWYVDGEAIEGATGASYLVPTDQVGEHSYYVVITSVVGDASNVSSVESSSTVVNIAESQQGGNESGDSSDDQPSKGEDASAANGTDQTGDQNKAGSHASALSKTGEVVPGVVVPLVGIAGLVAAGVALAVRRKVRR